ncbi:MAG: tetratricopeptide repeat protein [Deltaproteobacteria bacterium]|nr:tetratricopeptide repeat protein [Deltaproteobacteria bacterium]
MKSVLVLMVWLTTIAIAANASAQDTDEKELYRKGSALFDAGQFEEAAQTFRRAYEMKPHWKIRYNIGQSEAAAKNYASALEQFEAYLVEGGDELGAEREDMVTAEIRKLRTKVGILHIVAPSGAEVWVDGRHLGNTPLPGNLRVNAGELHELQIVFESKKILTRAVRLGSEETIQIVAEAPSSETVADDSTSAKAPEIATGDDVNAGDSEAASVPVDKETGENNDTPASKGDNALSGAGWTLISTGAAALIAGGIVGGLAISKNNELKDNCDTNTHVCTDEYEGTGRTGKVMGNLSTVLIPAGAALATTGIILLIMHKKKTETAVSFTPVASRQFAGFSLRGQF